ncbi:MAG: peptidylprolyl isomerase [Phycisphaerales bacterium]
MPWDDAGTTDLTPLMFEGLEQRLALYSSPFLEDLPTVSLMENPANTVVRIQTTSGVIDIELYDRFGPGTASAAPLTAANFLRYITTGRFDGTFFHRLEADFVLQGGGFTFTGGDAPPRREEMDTFDPVVNEFDAGRSNIERTLGMAKFPDQPDSATSQFFFNLKDNGSTLDPQNGGFTVFARVINGWEIVQEIAGLTVRNLNQFLTGAGSGPFDKVPLTGAADTDLVFIEDIEVIKPAGSQQFLTQSIYFPDGFRSGRIVSSIELVNPDPNAATPFQIIARFEDGRRDTVIFTNTLAPGAHWEVPISVGGDPTVNKVRGGAPFAYEVRSSHSIAATLHHKDFGGVASESFIQTGPFTGAQLQTWTFAGGVKGPDRPSYLVWQNLSGEAATVNILFFPEGGTPFFIAHTTEPFRRGGLDINQLPSVPDGPFSVEVHSTRPVVMALSQYAVAPADATTQTGTMGLGASEGVLPGAMIPTGGQSILSALFTGASPALVTIELDYILSDGTVLHNTAPFTLSPLIRRRDLDLAASNPLLPRDEFFTVRYRVQGGTPVSLSYRGAGAGDGTATAFLTAAAPTAYFAGGSTVPAQGADREVISIYNPFSGSTEMTYRLRFHFFDDPGAGGVIITPAGGEGTIAAGGRRDVSVRDLAEVMARINEGPQFRRYAVTIEAEFTGGSQTVAGAIFATLTRISPGDSAATGPGWGSGDTLVALTDPRF